MSSLGGDMHMVISWWEGLGFDLCAGCCGNIITVLFNWIIKGLVVCKNNISWYVCVHLKEHLVFEKRRQSSPGSRDDCLSDFGYSIFEILGQIDHKCPNLTFLTFQWPLEWLHTMYIVWQHCHHSNECKSRHGARKLGSPIWPFLPWKMTFRAIP